MDKLQQAPTKYSPGNQFCFPGDGYAYSVDRQLRHFRVPENEILPFLDGSKKHGNPTIDNLINFDIQERNKETKRVKRK